LVFHLVGDWVTRGEVTLTRSPVPYPLLDHNKQYKKTEDYVLVPNIFHPQLKDIKWFFTIVALREVPSYMEQTTHVQFLK
jgi:hypothetical protein